MHLLGDLNKCAHLPPQSILVYQMGKVGSITIRDYARDNFPNVLHTHKHEDANRFLLDHQRETTLVVTGVREPIERCISAFFQNIDNKAHKKFYIGPREVIKEMSMAEIKAFFINAFEWHIDNVMPTWFDKFANAIGYDLLTHQFDPTIGHVSIEIVKLRIHVYKLECINEFLDIFRSTYSLPETQMTPRNVGASKWSGTLYSQFIEELRLPEAAVRRLHSLPWVRHFYSAQELDAAAERFLGI